MPKSFFSALKSLVKDTFQSAGNHDVSLHGAAIAFYTIFSTAPLIILVLGLMNLVLSEQQTTQFFSYYLFQLMDRDIAQPLLEISEESGLQASGVIASLIATGVMLFGATTVVTQLKDSLNAIWGVTRTNINSVLEFVLNRFMALVTILLVTALFLASLLLEGGLTFFYDILLADLPLDLKPLITIGSSILSILITVLFFTLLFKILPDIKARWRDIFIGACVTSILFLIGKYLVGFYLGMASFSGSYKAAGSFVIFMIWIYYNVQVVLIGAEFTQIYTKRYGKNLQPSEKAEFTAGRF